MIQKFSFYTVRPTKISLESTGVFKSAVARKCNSFKYYYLKYKITLGDVYKFDFHDIGCEIKRKRETSGMTQDQLALIIDRDPRTIIYNENDGQHPSLNTFYQMVTMFDISVDQFFYPDMSADDACKKRINTLAALTLDRFGYWCYTLNNRNGYCVRRRK